ncbi:hypothetical protein FACS1894200_10970 [Spirochaetia bacterium]|nr:hypothetical protein FACS1894200_10970 [Spirochaetia bacterium]
MTIEQIVEIPASRRITFDLPFTVPVGTAKVELKVSPDMKTASETELEKYPWESAIGMFKGAGFSTEELFKERARDLLCEEAMLFHKISKEALEAAAKQGVSPAELGLEEFV